MQTSHTIFFHQILFNIIKLPPVNFNTLKIPPGTEENEHFLPKFCQEIPENHHLFLLLLPCKELDWKTLSALSNNPDPKFNIFEDKRQEHEAFHSALVLL